jgi:hypothetical protein
MTKYAALRFFRTLSYMKISILYPKLRLNEPYIYKLEKIMADRYMYLASPNLSTTNIVMATEYMQVAYKL